nr:hypothetical protein [Tanacetum cinerariifolium]
MGQHPEDLVSAEDEAPASLLSPRFLSPCIRPLSPRALEAEMNAIASSLYHSLHPSGTPPLLPIPLSTPSTSRKAVIPVADTSPQNRPLLATPRPGCEVEESSVAATARRPGPTMAHGDHAAVRAEIEVLRSERLAYKQEGIQTHEALARSEAYCRVLEARVLVLETYARRLEWQRQAADDFAIEHIMRTQASESVKFYELLPASRTRRGHTTPPTNHNNPNNMTLEAVQTMIDQALLRNSGGRDGSHRTEGAVGLTRWIEKMESVFNINGCAMENLVKFATCTLLDATLTWWNSQIRTLGPDAYTMTWIRDNNILAYTNCFQELALICTKFVSNEIEKVDKYISGLPDNIYRNVKSLKPKMLDETIELANDLMDQKLCTYTKRKSDSKRKADDISRNNQRPFKRQNRGMEMLWETQTQMSSRNWGSFDAIIGMDWLRRHHAVIAYNTSRVFLDLNLSNTEDKKVEPNLYNISRVASDLEGAKDKKLEPNLYNTSRVASDLEGASSSQASESTKEATQEKSKVISSRVFLYLNLSNADDKKLEPNLYNTSRVASDLERASLSQASEFTKEATQEKLKTMCVFGTRHVISAQGVATNPSIGAGLQQDGHRIVYLSKALALKHQTLSTYEKEFLAIMFALEK